MCTKKMDMGLTQSQKGSTISEDCPRPIKDTIAYIVAIWDSNTHAYAQG